MLQLDHLYFIQSSSQKHYFNSIYTEKQDIIFLYKNKDSVFTINVTWLCMRAIRVTCCQSLFAVSVSKIYEFTGPIGTKLGHNCLLVSSLEIVFFTKLSIGQLLCL